MKLGRNDGVTTAPLLRTARRIGVTGTDTGIGKTVVVSALLARGRQLGRSVSAMKPVESGAETHADSDASRLHRAAGADDDIAVMRPYALAEPLAPFLAAERAGVTIDVEALDRAAERLAQARDLLFVETAGGMMVPITRELTFCDLFRRWGAEIVIVAGNRLGVINHTLLTILAAEQAGLTIRGIVLTDFARGDASIAQATNFEALRAVVGKHAVMRFPLLDDPDDLEALAAAAAEAGLDDLLLTAR